MAALKSTLISMIHEAGQRLGGAGGEKSLDVGV
jgi:hypothetical protein